MPKPIPDGYHSVTPHLTVSNADKAIAFYKAALDAKELYRMPMPDGRVGHAELQIGDVRIMLADESPQMGNKSPRSVGGSPVSLCIYTADVESMVARFMKAGGKQLSPLENKFYGDRAGNYQDPEGYTWTLMQHVEDVSPEEMKKRMANMK